MKQRISRGVYICFSLLGIAFMPISSAQAALSAVTCGSQGIAATITIGSNGKYIGASYRLSDGSIYDLPPKKIKFGLASASLWSDYPSNVAEYRVSTWKGKSGSKMKGRIHDTGWRSC